MNAKYLKQKLVQGFKETNPHQDYRGYVGMSGIGGCPLDLYRRATATIPRDERLMWYGWTGYLHESAIKNLLGAHRAAILTFLGGAVPVGRELIADFDSRYRGHTDHELPDGTLIEIKSTNWRRYQQVQARGPDPRHVAQVQAYMRHGGYPHAIIIYVARDIFHQEWDGLPFWCCDVPPDAAIMDILDDRAKAILASIDANTTPACSCGYCRIEL